MVFISKHSVSGKTKTYPISTIYNNTECDKAILTNSIDEFKDVKLKLNIVALKKYEGA